MSGEKQVPIIGQDVPYPPWVLRTGFRNMTPAKCDTHYYIEQSEDADMQVLHVSLKRYQEILSESHDNMGYRSPSISVSRGNFGIRFKNMSGSDKHKMMITPGYNARVVPHNLDEYPEMVIKPENFLAAFDGNLRRDWAFREGSADGKIKLPLYNCVSGKGAVFFRTGGHSTWRNLEEGASILCAIPNLVAFQTFCDLELRTVDSPIESMFSKIQKNRPIPQIIPHLKVKGPGLLMLSTLHHEEHIYPLSLDEHPSLVIKPEVFMAASDTRLYITAEQMNRQGSKVPCGNVMMHLNGTGMVLLKLAGIVKFLVLAPTETIFLSRASLVGYQNSCKAVEEALPAPPANEFDDVSITGPGLLILQSACMEGLPPEHPKDCALPPPTKAKLKELAANQWRPKMSPEMVEAANLEARNRLAPPAPEPEVPQPVVEVRTKVEKTRSVKVIKVVSTPVSEQELKEEIELRNNVTKMRSLPTRRKVSEKKSRA